MRSHLTFANVASGLALFIALGGTAYAINTVSSSDIVDGQVRTDDLGAAAVTNVKLADNAVGKTKISGGAVENGKLADGAVGQSKLANGAVSNAKIAAGAVTSQQVQNGSLTGADVFENSLKGSDIDESSLEGLGSAAGARAWGYINSSGELFFGHKVVGDAYGYSTATPSDGEYCIPLDPSIEAFGAVMIASPDNHFSDTFDDKLSFVEPSTADMCNTESDMFVQTGYLGGDPSQIVRDNMPFFFVVM